MKNTKKQPVPKRSVFKFSRGRWRVELKSRPSGVVPSVPHVYSEFSDLPVAVLHGYLGQEKYNARLIAAAPSLAQGYVEILDRLGSLEKEPMHSDELAAFCRKMIRKVKCATRTR